MNALERYEHLIENIRMHGPYLEKFLGVWGGGRVNMDYVPEGHSEEKVREAPFYKVNEKLKRGLLNSYT